MLVLKCNIQITSKDSGKKVTFNYVTDVNITTSIKDLTDTATVVVPRKMSWMGKRLSDYIQRADAISICLGYQEYGLVKVFEGYITSIINDYQTTISAENGMWLLKQAQVPAQRWKRFDLSQFFATVLPSLTTHIPTMSFGEVVLTHECSIAFFIAELQKKYPFKLFFKAGELWASILKAELAASGVRVHLTYGKNMVSDSLVYTSSDQVKIIIKAKSILANNKKIEVTSPKGAKEGEIRTLYNASCKSEDSLQHWADQMLQEYKSDRMSGEITLLGIPSVQKTDRVTLHDSVRKERDGLSFIVEGVRYQFGSGGYRQVIKLGDKI